MKNVMRNFISCTLILIMALTATLPAFADEEIVPEGEAITELLIYLNYAPLCGQEVGGDPQENAPDNRCRRAA